MKMLFGIKNKNSYTKIVWNFDQNTAKKPAYVSLIVPNTKQSI